MYHIHTHRYKMENKVIEYLKNEIYFRVQPSPVHGVGLFAIKDIPNGTNIIVEFPHEFSEMISKSKLVGIHENVLKLFNGMYYSTEEFLRIKLYPFLKLHYITFMNHSDTPNMYLSKEDGVYSGITLSDIKIGEEIFEDYSKLAKLSRGVK